MASPPPYFTLPGPFCTGRDKLRICEDIPARNRKASYAYILGLADTRDQIPVLQLILTRVNSMIVPPDAMVCPRCRVPQPPQANFCSGCGRFRYNPSRPSRYNRSFVEYRNGLPVHSFLARQARRPDSPRREYCKSPLQEYPVGESQKRGNADDASEASDEDRGRDGRIAPPSLHR